MSTIRAHRHHLMSMINLNIITHNVLWYKYNFRYIIHPMQLSGKDMKIMIMLEVRLFRASLVLGAKETFPERT